MDCHFLLQKIFLDQGSRNPLHWQEGSLPLRHLGSPRKPDTHPRTITSKGFGVWERAVTQEGPKVLRALCSNLPIWSCHCRRSCRDWFQQCLTWAQNLATLIPGLGPRQELRLLEESYLGIWRLWFHPGQKLLEEEQDQAVSSAAGSPWCSLERTQSSLLGLWSQRVSQADIGPDLSHMDSSVPEIPPLRLSNSFLLAIKDNFISYLVFFLLLKIR